MGDVLLEIPAKTAYLSLARQVVAAAAAVEPTFRTERIDDLRIAVSEATTNAISANLDLNADERIKIKCNLGDDRIEVEVVDSGAGFDPGTVQSAPEATHPDRLNWESGLGLPLMKELTDVTEIRSGSGGTRVRLVVFRTRK